MAIYAGNWYDEEGNPFDPDGFPIDTANYGQWARRTRLSYTHRHQQTTFCQARRLTKSYWDNMSQAQKDQWVIDPGKRAVNRDDDDIDMGISTALMYSAHRFADAYHGLYMDGYVPENLFPHDYSLVITDYHTANDRCYYTLTMWPAAIADDNWALFVYQVNPFYVAKPSWRYQTRLMAKWATWEEGETVYELDAIAPFPRVAGQTITLWSRARHWVGYDTTQLDDYEIP